MYKNILLEIEQILKSIHPGACLTMVPKGFDGHFATNLLLLDKTLESHLYDKLNHYVCNFINVDGFINMLLKPEILESTEFDYNFGNNENIGFEYCSPNPTGPIHLGHCRNIVVGKTMINILKFCNYNVFTELYINDCGNQIGQFVESIGYWQDMDSQGYSDKTLYYMGEYMKDLSKKFTKENVLQNQINLLIEKLKSIGINYDRITYESSLNTDETMKLLEDKNLLTHKSDGSIWLKDKVLKKNDGNYTYFANDITYHLWKSKNNNVQIIVLGEDQRGNFSHLQKLLSQEFNIKLDIILIGTVHVRQNNELMKLSKRSGNIITIDDLLNNMSLGELFCNLLDAKLHKSITIDYDNRSLDNTMFQLQYLANLMNNIQTNHNELTIDDNYICGLILFFPKVLRESIKSLDPHRFYTYIKTTLAIIYDYISLNREINWLLKKYISLITTNTIFIIGN
jgi:arginyl-tRNA synthetase